MRRLLGYSGLLALGIFGAMAPAHTQVPERYAALVEDYDGGYRAFSSANQPTPEAARDEALRQCGKGSCELVLVFGGAGCGSFHSAGPEGAFGWAVKEKLAEARSESLALCREEIQGSEVCSNSVSICNTQGGGQAQAIFSLNDVTDQDEDGWF